MICFAVPEKRIVEFMQVFEYTHASVEHPDRDEDAILVFPGGDNAPVFAVIDGMGGHQRITENGQTLTGRDASQAIRAIFIEDLEHFPLDAAGAPGSETELRVMAAIQRANQHVFNDINHGEESEIRERVGAVGTLVVVCENGSKLLVAQVGDTRAYLFTEGELIQLLEDEDNIDYMVQQGLLDTNDGEKIAAIVNTYDGVNEPNVSGSVRIGEEEYELYLAWRWFVTGNTALRIPGANVVVNSIGTGGEDLEVLRTRIEVLPGDTLLLASDGLYKNLSEAEIIAGLNHTGDPAAFLGEQALARSQDSNNRRMNPDDISVIVVRL
jgi:serine/threonine protein phosphatase PrpC